MAAEGGPPDAGTFLAMNGDILTDLDFGGMLRFHERSEAEATIAVKTVDDPSRFGVIEARDGRVEAFLEKPERPAASGPAPINAGIYIFGAHLLSQFPQGVCSLERDVFPLLIEQGAKCCIAAKQRIDLIIVMRVVTMIGR